MSQGGANSSTSGGLNIPVTVPEGGTGQITFPVHTVLLGEGTSPIGNTGPGTAGQVLTSNGAGLDPTFQSAPMPSSNVNATLDFYDDFLYFPCNIIPNQSDLNDQPTGIWEVFQGGSISSTCITQAVAVSGHPGTVTLATSTMNTHLYIALSTSYPTANLSPIVLGAGITTITWYFNINTLSNSTTRYILSAGFGDTVNIGSSNLLANGCYVNYSDNLNSGDWQFATAAANTQTVSNSSTAVATGWQVIQVVVNAAASSVAFYAGTTLANLTSLGTAITTNIPTNAISPYFQLIKTTGAGNITVDLDLVTINIPLTTAR